VNSYKRCLGPAQMFGELAVYDPGPRTSSAIALTSVQTLAVDGAQLRGWIPDQPETAERLLRLLARRLRRTIENWTDVVSHDVPARLAKQLLQRLDAGETRAVDRCQPGEHR
jgi:CRP/FNR family transcriptional regulator, cyclic AMP receptor protein